MSAAAAGVEPGVVGRNVPAVGADADDAGHLAVDAHGGHLGRVDLRLRRGTRGCSGTPRGTGTRGLLRPRPAAGRCSRDLRNAVPRGRPRRPPAPPWCPACRCRCRADSRGSWSICQEDDLARRPGQRRTVGGLQFAERIDVGNDGRQVDRVCRPPAAGRCGSRGPSRRSSR